MDSPAIARARRGDLSAFEELIRMHERHVFTLAYRLMGNVPDAQDAAQEVYLRLYRQIGSFDEGREFRPWLTRITANVCMDLLRKRRTLVPIESIRPPAAADQTDEAFDVEQRRLLVNKALETLPAKQRAAIVLRDVEGLSTAQVAEALGTTETTIRSQISTGRLRLRQVVQQLLRRKS